MKHIIILLIALVVSQSAFSQSKQDKAKAKELLDQAIDLVDAGRYEEGILLLKQADKLDPKDSGYKYEIAYATYSQQKYKEANKILESIIKKKDATAVYFQLLGNTYDILGDPGKAMETYQAGLKKFPDAGILHFEQGVVLISQEKYSDATLAFEKGVDADPTYASNYYCLAQLYSGSNFPLYSAMYGEIFVNLERNTKRTKEISKLLYNVYKEAITIGDTSGSVSFTKKNILTLEDLQKMSKGVLPFSMQFETTMLLSSAFAKRKFDLDFLSSMRKNFVKQWCENGYTKAHPNVLIDYWKKMDDQGYFDAYNYWLFQMGATDEVAAWRQEHGTEYDAFVEYYTNHPIEITPKNYYSSIPSGK